MTTRCGRWEQVAEVPVYRKKCRSGRWATVTRTAPGRWCARLYNPPGRQKHQRRAFDSKCGFKSDRNAKLWASRWLHWWG